MSKLRVVLAVLALVVGAGRLSAQQYVVVVNASNPVTSVAKGKLNDIFLKRVTRWDNGTAVMPVNLDRLSATREAFTRTVHGKSLSAMETFWQLQIFAGKDAPPPQRATEAEVLAYVRANPGAIGYVSASASLGDAVKAVTVN